MRDCDVECNVCVLQSVHAFAAERDVRRDIKRDRKTEDLDGEESQRVSNLLHKHNAFCFPLVQEKR